jgi:tripartite motif-containing protein 71
MHIQSTNRAGNSRIVIMDAANGEFVTTFGAEGSQPGNLNSPLGVACGPHGDIVVCDSANRRVQVFDREGTLLQLVKFGGKVCGVAVTGEGHVWVTDDTRHQIHVLGPVSQ